MLAGATLALFGALALWVAPPRAWDSRDVLVLAVAFGGVAFTLVGARRLNADSSRTM